MAAKAVAGTKILGRKACGFNSRPGHQPLSGAAVSPLASPDRVTSLLDEIFAPRVAVRVYGLGAIVFGLVGLVWGDFSVVWQLDLDRPPPQTVIAYAATVPFLVAGLATQWKPAAWRGALALTVLYGLGAVVLWIPRALKDPMIFGTWEGAAEQVALVAGGLIAYAALAPIKTSVAARLFMIGRLLFGMCLIIFGLAHFFYLKFTADMVPAWLPPSQNFWVYATAVGHLAAGVAMLSGILVRVAGMLLTAMFVVFGILVHVPAVYLDPHSHNNWTENAINFALIGSAWVIAASFPSRKPAA